MNVVHLSTRDIVGGAARAAYRLHVGLRKLGCESTMLVAERQSDDTSVKRYQVPVSPIKRFQRRMRMNSQRKIWQSYEATRPKGLELFSSDQSQLAGEVNAAIPPCEIVHLHWVAGLIDYDSFFTQVANRTPVVWTLHDMNPFTGGCHYNVGCNAYVSECGACPQLGSSTRGDLANVIFRRKRRALSHTSLQRLCIISPSKWLAHVAQNSALFRNLEIQVIPYGLDLTTFKPCNKLAAREVLGIDPDAKVVLFVAHSIENRRKGFDLLRRALDIRRPPEGWCLLTVGRDEFALSNTFPHLHLGTINSDKFLSIVYSAADVFVVPSREDNLPLTALEAMACGTPLVAFGVGGMPEIVRPGITGLLAQPESITDLRDCITKLLAEPSLRTEMAANCRRVAVEEYSLELQAGRYSDLYDSVLCGMS